MEVRRRHDLRVWLVHHVAFALMLYLNPQAPTVDYHASKEALVEQAVQFALLGAGFKCEAIKWHYSPRRRSCPSEPLFWLVGKPMNTTLQTGNIKRTVS